MHANCHQFNEIRYCCQTISLWVFLSHSNKHTVSYLFYNLKKIVANGFYFNYRLIGIFSELHKITDNTHVKLIISPIVSKYTILSRIRVWNTSLSGVASRKPPQDYISFWIISPFRIRTNKRRDFTFVVSVREWLLFF